MKRLKRHLTYANVMSSLAVFLLLGAGSALAAKKHNTQKIGSTQIKASAVTAAKIKNGAVSNSKLAAAAVSTEKLAESAVGNSKLADGSVTTSKLAADAVTGDKVNESSLGEVPSANSANPAVFAHVNSNGVVDAANAKGLTSPNVSHSATGVYCISISSFTPRGGQATPQTGEAVGAQISVGGSCPLQVTTVTGAGTATNSGFYVEIYR
ncbi:MAG TPA: hypothetical protein VHU86_03590 [Solirubrobacterales bacterium]|jgi:hypothetical protein|nr:hypothetical protein [Solirubrobacterales bacterium]